jgi:predicted O-methyltransferase YrrM
VGRTAVGADDATRVMPASRFEARARRSRAVHGAYLLYVAAREEVFRRRSPLPRIDLRAELFRHELVFPPRRDLAHPGMQTVDGLFALGSVAAEVAARVVFEIGTFRGVTAWFLVRNLANAEVHTLDIPPEAEPVGELEESDVFRAARDMYYEGRPDGERVVQHWGDSANFDFSPWYGRCDLVYIDGAHSAAYVRNDSDQALKMIKPGGAIVWDDYWWQSPGTARTLHALHEEGVPLRWIKGTRLVVHVSPGA